MALGVDALQLLQGGLASPQTLQDTGCDQGSPTHVYQPHGWPGEDGVGNASAIFLQF